MLIHRQKIDTLCSSALKLCRTDTPERKAPQFVAIKDFDVFEDTGSSRPDGSILLAIDLLDLEPAAEGFHYSPSSSPDDSCQADSCASGPNPFFQNHFLHEIFNIFQILTFWLKLSARQGRPLL